MRVDDIWLPPVAGLSTRDELADATPLGDIDGDDASALLQDGRDARAAGASAPCLRQRAARKSDRQTVSVRLGEDVGEPSRLEREERPRVENDSRASIINWLDDALYHG